MQRNKLSIVVIAYNEERFISTLLGSLALQASGDFELIVVDSNSTDGTAHRAREFSSRFGEFRYLRLKETLGPGHARNRGAEISNYGHILFLDADTMLPLGFLDQISKEFQNKGLDIATCPLMVLRGGVGSNFGAFLLNTMMVILKPFYSVGYGACLMVSRTVHDRIEGFDETLGICEDCNYIKRARRANGYKFGILSTNFYTSDRRLGKNNGKNLVFKYLRVHLYRIFTGREIKKGSIDYKYGIF